MSKRALRKYLFLPDNPVSNILFNLSVYLVISVTVIPFSANILNICICLILILFITIITMTAHIMGQTREKKIVLTLSKGKEPKNIFSHFILTFYLRGKYILISIQSFIFLTLIVQNVSRGRTDGRTDGRNCRNPTDGILKIPCLRHQYFFSWRMKTTISSSLNY